MIKSCPHCGNNEVVVSSEYIWYCQKCTRYQMRPITTAMPMRPEMLDHEIKMLNMEYINCANPECGKRFRRKVYSPRILCGHCYNLKVSNEGRIRRAEKLKAQKEMSAT